jgi:hypothetical protein
MHSDRNDTSGIDCGFVTELTGSGAAQEFMAQSGAPASSFPRPDRPVARIVSPIWKDEETRDDAGDPGQLVRLLGTRIEQRFPLVRLHPPRDNIVRNDRRPRSPRLGAI